MAQKDQHDQQPQRDAHKVLFHPTRPLVRFLRSAARFRSESGPGGRCDAYDAPVYVRADQTCEKYGLLRRLEVELHLHAGKLDHIVIAESMRLRVELPAVDDWKAGPFHVGDEVALRTFRNHCNLHPRLT